MADVGVKGLAVLKLFIQCVWIGLSLTFPPAIQEKLIKYRQNWEILNGRHENKVIPYSKVLHFEPYTNGVQIQKDSGKSPFLEFSTDVPLFATILNQLLGRN